MPQSGPWRLSGCGVVKLEEGVEELVVGDLFGVEIEFDDFSVAGLVSADVAVGWAIQLSAFISNGCRRYAGDCGEAASTPQKHPAPNVAFSVLILIRCYRGFLVAAMRVR